MEALPPRPAFPSEPALAAPGSAFSADPVPWDGAARMAADRAALAAAERALAAGGALEPAMAWWAWERPTISLGRLQDARAVAPGGLPVVRRPTGGGAILHAAEWTWSALVPLAHPRLGGGLAAASAAVVAVVARALETVWGIAVDAAPGHGHLPAGAAAGAGGGAACFAGLLGHELAVGGRKLMGSAQRRGRHAFLQQGSLLVGPGHERLELHLAAGDPGAGGVLARRTVTLRELLGRDPDPAPFLAAVAAAWAEAASGRCEAPAGALDSAGRHS